MSLQAAQPTKKLLEAMNGAFRGFGRPLVVLGDATSASPTLTNVADTSQIDVGEVIAGNAVPVGTTVISKTASTITMSANATANTVQQPYVQMTVNGGAGVSDLQIGLFTGNPTLSIDTVLADLTEPTYTGYARQSVALGSLRENSNGDQINPLASASFQPSDAVGLPETATGVFLVGSVDGTDFLLLAEFLDNAFTFSSALSGLDVDVDTMIRNGPYYGGICSTC